MNADGLTDKQRTFVSEYIRTMNATASARAAGYGVKGAHVTGSRLLKKAKVRDRIEEHLGRKLGGAVGARRRILQTLEDLAEADITDVLEVKAGGVAIKDSAEWPARAKKAVRKVRIKTSISPAGDVSTEYNVELAQPVAAMDLIAKIKGMVVDRKLLGNDPKNPLPSSVVTYQLPDNGRDSKPEDAGGDSNPNA